jgi:hypothetical protein
MKISILLSAALFVFSFLCPSTWVSAAEKIDSSHAGDRIALDGDSSDWEGIPVTYLEDSLRIAAIAHNDGSLYLMYRFADENLARQLLMRGVTLWVNGDGKNKKKNEDFAVRYPGSEQIAEHFEGEDAWDQQYRAETEGSETSGHSGPPPSLASMRHVPGQLTVIRMGVKETIAENNSEGPTAASALIEGVFCYELKIPFADIGGRVANTDPTRERKIAIGIQIGGMTEAEMETAQAAMQERTGSRGETGGRGGEMGGMGGRPPGGGGMGGMGGMSGGSPGGAMVGRGGDPRSRMSPQVEWLSITLPAGE